jgi:hypothetical protein
MKWDISLSNQPYLIINIFFAGVILLIIAYSGIFSPVKGDYPIVCIHEKLTGQPCISCGLSHSFSLIVRGKVSEALMWNVYGLRVFLFFACQLILRIAFSLFYMKNSGSRTELIILDSISSFVIFLIAFWPYLQRILTDL